MTLMIGIALRQFMGRKMRIRARSDRGLPSKHLVGRNIAYIDNETVPVGPVDGNGETDSILILVKGDAANLHYLNMAVRGKIEVSRLLFIGGTPFYCVVVPGLLGATFGHIGDRPLFNIARIQ